MNREEIAKFISEKNRYMELPEEDIQSYLARRAAMRKSARSASRLSKRKPGGIMEDSPIALKKPRMSDETELFQNREQVVVASGSSRTPVQIVANLRVDEPIDVDPSPQKEPVATSSSHKPELLPKTSINDRSGSPVVALKSDSDVLHEQATSSKRPSSKLRRPVIGRRASVLLISHQLPSKTSTSHNNAVIKITPKEAPPTADADTSNITTPTSSLGDASKKETVSNRLDAVENVKRTTKAAAPAGASRSTVESKNVSSAQDLSEPSTTSATNNVNRPITALPRPEPPKKKAATKKQAKEKPPKMTPPEYAEWLIAKYSNPNRKVVQKNAGGLRGTTIFYVGGELNLVVESTRKRMEHILKYGGTLVSQFDPDLVTHIVTDTGESATAKAAGLRSISEIPMHIPTLRWSWVSSESGKRPVDPTVQNDTRYWDHVAFGSRFHAGESAYLKNKAVILDKGKGKVVENDPDDSRISQFTDNSNDSDHNSDHSPLHTSEVLTAGGLTSKRVGKVKKDDKGDPLAEFYSQAKADVDAKGRWDVDESEDEVLPPDISAARAKSGWACVQKREDVGPPPNQDIVDKLKELQEIHRSKPGEENSWRVFSYNKSLRSILNYPKRIESYGEARSIRGVGEKTALKIMEIIQSGELRRICYENTDDVRVSRLFQGIFGVGSKTAFTWYANGARTLDDLLAGKGGIKLTSQQKIGIRFYDDINERMPRDEAEDIFKKIQSIALNIDPKLFIEIMGSFRRGAVTCGDIDVMITRPTDDGKTHVGVVMKIWKECHAQGIITEDLVMPDDFNDLELIYRGLCRRDENSKHRRIDFLSVPWKCRGAALLYYTGDSIFNRSLRLKARQSGMSLNQRGLFGGVVRSVKDAAVKTNEGHILASETEEEILRILNVPWQEPHDRVRGDMI